MTEMDIKNMQREQRLKTFKSVVRFVVVGLVETFVGAATTLVVDRVDSNRLAKFGAKAGGFLAGMYVGDQVADHILGSIDETLNEIEELKKSMEEA